MLWLMGIVVLQHCYWPSLKSTDPNKGYEGCRAYSGNSGWDVGDFS